MDAIGVAGERLTPLAAGNVGENGDVSAGMGVSGPADVGVAGDDLPDNGVDTVHAVAGGAVFATDWLDRTVRMAEFRVGIILQNSTRIGVRHYGRCR